jgi:hypothetical protein
MFNKKYFALLLSVLMLMALLCGCGETADVTDTTTADTSVDITTTAPVEEVPKAPGLFAKATGLLMDLFGRKKPAAPAPALQSESKEDPFPVSLFLQLLIHRIMLMRGTMA